MAAEKVNHSTADQIREQAGVIGEDIQELGRIAREVVTDKYQAGREKAVALEKTVEDQIKRHPMRAVLIAAGAGLLIGVLWARR